MEQVNENDLVSHSMSQHPETRQTHSIEKLIEDAKVRRTRKANAAQVQNPPPGPPPPSPAAAPVQQQQHQQAVVVEEPPQLTVLLLILLLLLFCK